MRALLAVLLLVVGAPWMFEAQQASAAQDIYISDGYFEVAGRRWHTVCEPYSQTKRCRSEIWATTVTQVNGRFVQKNGWVFNNLTYSASPRSLWRNNALGGNGVVGGAPSWTTHGRQWRTECDSTETGRGGCRSYIFSREIESYRTSAGTWAFRWVDKWVFNNMVRFTPDGVGAPGGVVDLAAIPDEQLRACIGESVDLGQPRWLTPYEAASITRLDCSARSISSLARMPMLAGLEYLDLSLNSIATIQGLDRLPALTDLNLYGNQITQIQGLGALGSLQKLDLGRNQIPRIEGLSTLTSPRDLDLASNSIPKIEGLGSLTGLTNLSLYNNKITTAQGLESLTNLTTLDLGLNELLDASSLAPLTSLRDPSLAGNLLGSVAGLQGLPNLQSVLLRENPGVTGLEMLQPLVDAGCYVDIWPTTPGGGA